MSLNQDTILITSLANDLGYEQIFYRQLQVVAKKEDLVVGFSVSGKSKNVVNALKFAKEKKMRTVGFLGSDGGDVLSLVDIPVLIENTNTLLGFTEDIHMTICHIVAYYLEFSYKNDRSE